VECTPELIRSLKDEERVRVLAYLIDEKGLRARDLGVTINFISMVKSGRRRVSDSLLCRALTHLTPEELARLLGNQPEPAIVDAEAPSFIREGELRTIPCWLAVC